MTFSTAKFLHQVLSPGRILSFTGLLTGILFMLNPSAHAFYTEEEPPEKVEVFVSDFSEHVLRQRMEQTASTLLTAVNQAYLQDASPNLSEDFYSDTLKTTVAGLWDGAAFYFPEARTIENVSVLTNGNYEMRGIPAYLDHHDKDETSYEEVVLQFNPDGEVTELRIGLPQHRYQALLSESQDEVDDRNRRQILEFIESFRTAYNKKDLDFIETVFSDEALIIVGRVVESTGAESPFESQVEYLRFNKNEYIERLAAVFEANSWIEVGFEEISIYRHPRHTHMYGVSLTQFYNSEIYSDTGYLFLLTDFRTPEEPMIHVRTWQPRYNTPEGEVFSIGDIEIF